MKTGKVQHNNTTVPDAFGFLRRGSKSKSDEKGTGTAAMEASSNLEIQTFDKDSDYYKMNHNKRGIAVIFNHYKFEDTSLTRRDGTFKDAKDLKKILTELSFDVIVYTDLKYGAVYDTLSDLADSDHSDSDCLLIAVMSHGESGKVYAKDYPYPVDDLWKPFTGDKCATLVGKPKIFFIQACRGKEVDDGVIVHAGVSHDSVSVAKVFSIPVMSDILVMYSTYDGYYSWRSPLTGSWFIQSICDEFKKYAKDRDLLTILTFVNRRLAIRYKSNVPDAPNMHAKKQIGTIVSTFTRLLHFYPIRQ